MASLREEIESRAHLRSSRIPTPVKPHSTENSCSMVGHPDRRFGQGQAERQACGVRLDGIEKQRGISVTSSVLQFNYQGKCINILDTPGHQDFSEDTYRTLMAADSAVMVIDAAKGVRPRPSSCSRSARCATSRSSPSSTRWTARPVTRLS